MARITLRLACALQPPPHIHPQPAMSEMGVKTKTQLLAERSVLRQLITSVVAASADKDLREQGSQCAPLPKTC